MLVFGNMGTQKKREIKNAAAFLPLFLALSFVFFLFARNAAIDKAVNAAQGAPLLDETRAEIAARLDELYPERKELLCALPYEAPAADFELKAGAAILVDYNTGFVLFQKNADQGNKAK